MEGMTHRSVEDLLDRVRGEYLEMPGLRLTCAQASRLWGLDAETCEQLLLELMDRRFLQCTPDGRYGRLDTCASCDSSPTSRFRKKEEVVSCC